MTDWAYIGKKGTGKSKNAVRTIVSALKAKRRVATNLDLKLEPLFGAQSRITYVRVPDKPCAYDLVACGHGNPGSYDEDRAGVMVLDELGTWFNTRTYADKGRLATLDFLAQARKFGWDVVYIMQGLGQVDKQLRENFVEFTVRHVALKKVKIPLVGGVLSALFGEKAGYMPALHMAATRMGTDPLGLTAGREMFKGYDVQNGYDTYQEFREDYPHGAHSVLSPWHVTGRYLLSPKLSFWERIFAPPVRALPPPPVTRPDPAFARVVALARALPPAQALAVVARYASRQALAGARYP